MSETPGGISELTATLKGSILTVERHRARQSSSDRYDIDISGLDTNATQVTPITSKSKHYSNRLLLTKEFDHQKKTLVVYTEQGIVQFYVHNNTETHPLSRLIVVKSKVGYIRLTKRGIRLVYVIAISNIYDIPIKASYLTVGSHFRLKKDYPIYHTMPSKLKIIKNLFTDYISLPPLLEGEVPINTPIGVALDLGDTRLAEHSLSRGNWRYVNRTKWYYAPITQTRLGGYSISIRRNSSAGLSLTRRPLEAIEKTPFFRVIESRVISFLLYYSAHLARLLSSHTVNIYFEKNANKADEGTLELFRKARDESETKNFFVINKWSSVYDSLKDERDIVANFTLRSYWLMYRANNVIATEVPQHVNILRSGNKYVRRAPYTQKFIFLQHGIIYLKSLSKTTSFSKGREGEPDCMVISSQKEREIVTDLFNIEEERLLNTGLASYDTIKHNHITDKSEDIVTIMLTWRPSEEHLKNLSKSRYYNIVRELLNLLSSSVPKNNIRVVVHPRFVSLMRKTDLKDAIWQGTIADAIADTKLLITDYSSICYYAFFQGAGVIFYQPDLAEYEYINGTLIPAENEYIGPRCLTKPDITRAIHDTITSDGRIQLKGLRKSDFLRNYASINEHIDGHNIERLYSQLERLDIL